MKAAIRRKYGLPDQIGIQTTLKPEPKKQEVLVQVNATTVNRTDCANLTAKPFIMRFILGLFKPRRIILGTDFAGTVVSLGADVKSFRKGDRVFGFRDMGQSSQAQFLVSSVDYVFPIPDQIDFKSAAASLEGAHYAYTFVRMSTILPGQKVMINGASGAIGSALIQFLSQFDVSITATCGPKNTTLIKSLGADKVIDYTRADFTEVDEKFDFVFDTVGKSTFGKCKSILKEKGVYISSELGPYSQNIFYALWSHFSKGRKVKFPIPYQTKLTIPYISEMLKKGVFKPVIDREYSLNDIADAYTYVMSGQKTGNVVINVVPSDGHEL